MKRKREARNEPAIPTDLVISVACVDENSNGAVKHENKRRTSAELQVGLVEHCAKRRRKADLEEGSGGGGDGKRCLKRRRNADVKEGGGDDKRGLKRRSNPELEKGGGDDKRCLKRRRSADEGTGDDDKRCHKRRKIAAAGVEDDNDKRSPKRRMNADLKHAGDQSSKPHLCPTCGKRFSRATHLRRHVESVHEGKLPHECPQCDKRFAHMSSFRRHMSSVHEGRQPHRCPQCDKSFSDSSNFKRHVASVHDKKRPHECARCEKSFGDKAALKRHVASLHADARPHVCPRPRCDKAFARRGNLSAHIKSVHDKVKTHKCPLCDKSFSHKGHVTRHVAGVHDKEGGSSENENDTARQSVKLDPFDSDVFTDQEEVLCNVLTHSTSPEACDAIRSSGEWRGSAALNARYDGVSQDGSFRAAFFMTHPQSEGTLFPFSRYPRRLADGAAVKIMRVGAETLLDDNLTVFYVASTPTQFGAPFQRVYQSLVYVVRADDAPNLARAAELGFISLEKRRNALLSFDADGGGDRARVATRVRVAGNTFPNAVVVGFCDKLRVEPDAVTAVDGVKFAFRNGKVTCPHESCNFRVDSLHSLKQHYRNVHLKLKLYACRECESMFSRQLTLERHIASAHKKARKPHNCAQCDVTCWSESQLKRHVASVHDKKRPHECVQCEKKFADASTLRRHVACVHEERRPHECSSCGKSFSQMGNLRVHCANVHGKA